jgi:hypothetical protein
MIRMIAVAVATLYLGLTTTSASAGWNDDQKNRWSGNAQRNCVQNGQCPGN